MGKSRRKQCCSIFLEHLPNELIIQIFSYLNGVDAYFAFSQLNRRFLSLLTENCEFFDYKSINKFNFDLILQTHNSKRWRSLQLSDDKHTPNHLEYFCQFYSLVNDFPQLRSLSIINMNPVKTYTIISQLPSLINLVSLTIESICGNTMTSFDLPNLKRLVFTSCINTSWIKNFRRLEHVEYTTRNCHFHAQELEWPSTLKRLKIIYEYDSYLDHIKRSLNHLTSLKHLEIYEKSIGREFPDGRLWENLINSSFPQLRAFKFYFHFEYSSQTFDRIEQVISSFSTPFYVVKKRWFIRCDLSDIYQGRALLYSLPFPFEIYTPFKGLTTKSISTFPGGDDSEFCADTFSNVETLEVLYQSSEPDENFKRNKVINLIIYNGFDSIKWIHVLHKLQHLDINFYARISSRDLLLLLKNAPRLSSLVAEKSLLQTATEHWSCVPICDQLSRKIRSLELCRRRMSSQSISRNEIQQLIRIFSSLCQHLSIFAQLPLDTVGSILQNMPQLHSLHILISPRIASSIDMIWLQQQQTKFNSSNCIIVNEENYCHFWLGQHP